MKSIITILVLFLSVSVFSAEAQHEPKADLEAGVMFGYITSSGFFLKYNIDDDISLRGSGYLAKLDNYFYYNGKLTLSKTIHNSKYGEFYLLGSVGGFWANSNEGMVRDSDEINLYFLSGGLGYKYKAEKGINIFFELEQNLMFTTERDGLLFIPIPTMGISVDF